MNSNTIGSKVNTMLAILSLPLVMMSAAVPFFANTGIAMADTLAERVEAARSEYESLCDQAEDISEEMNATSERIAELEEQSETKQTELASTRASLQGNVIELYKLDSDAFVEMAARIFSSSDAQTMLDTMMTLTKIIPDITSKTEDVIRITDELKANIDEQKQLLAQQEESKAELDAKAEEAEAYLDELEEELQQQLRSTVYNGTPQTVQVATGESWRDAVIAEAYANLGGAYVWGGASRGACDCSGLVCLCYSKVGLSLFHGADTQARLYCHKPVSEAQPGDIVYRYSGHSGIYVGGGTVIHAANPAAGICYTQLSTFDLCGSPFD